MQIFRAGLWSPFNPTKNLSAMAAAKFLQSMNLGPKKALREVAKQIRAGVYMCVAQNHHKPAQTATVTWVKSPQGSGFDLMLS